jgi:hypothetical protein
MTGRTRKSEATDDATGHSGTDLRIGALAGPPECVYRPALRKSTTREG